MTATMTELTDQALAAVIRDLPEHSQTMVRFARYQADGYALGRAEAGDDAARGWDVQYAFGLFFALNAADHEIDRYAPLWSLTTAWERFTAR